MNNPPPNPLNLDAIPKSMFEDLLGEVEAISALSKMLTKSWYDIH